MNESRIARLRRLARTATLILKDAGIEAKAKAAYSGTVEIELHSSADLSSAIKAFADKGIATRQTSVVAELFWAQIEVAA